MSDNALAAVVLAAGLGTRMRSETPKHLHPLLGRRLVDWVVQAARDAGVERIVLVLFAVFFKWLLILGLIACAVIALAFLWFDRR